MYRFLLRPRWVLFTTVVVALVVLMVNLGLWQLRRLDERKAFNRVVATRQERAPVPLADVLAATDDAAVGKAVEWTQVEVHGRFDQTYEVLVRNRSFDGQPGYHVLTPLVVDGGGGAALVVNRGWIPLSTERGVTPDIPAPPSGDVDVVARLRPSQQRGRIGPRDPADGIIDQLARADLARLQQQVPYDLWPVYAELARPAPASGELPRLLPVPELDEGPHLSYAGQWFTFSLLAIVGWAVLVRRRARELARPAPAPHSGATVASTSISFAHDRPRRGDPRPSR